MDGSMFPDGWHPCRDSFARHDILQPAKPFTRIQRPPKYYFIDFSISRRYETSEDKAFSTDIYYMGTVIRDSLLRVRTYLKGCLRR